MKVVNFFLLYGKEHIVQVNLIFHERKEDKYLYRFIHVRLAEHQFFILFFEMMI